MNAQPINEMNNRDAARSMNSYLQRQSRKSLAFFEGNGHVRDLVERHEQEWARMEECLRRSRERIEKAIVSVKMASANATQLDDDTTPFSSVDSSTNH